MKRLEGLRTGLAQSMIRAGLQLMTFGGQSRARGGYDVVSTRRRKPRYSMSPGDLAVAVEASVWAYVCVHSRASGAARIKRNIYHRVTGQIMHGTPWHRAEAWAYTQFNQNLIYNHIASWMVWGDVFLEKLYWGESNRFPGGLRILNSAVTSAYAPQGEILWYEYQGGAGLVKFEKRDIFHSKLWRASSDIKGLSPLMVALGVVEIDQNTQDFIRSFYANDATPGGLLTAREGATIGEEEVELIQEFWRESFKGANNAFSTALMPWQLEYQKIGAEPPPGQQEHEESAAKKITGAFRVPMSIAGSGGVSDPLSAGSTLDGQTANFWEQVIIPDTEMLAEFHNTYTLPWLGMEDCELRFETDEVLGLIYNNTERVTMYQTRYNGGSITLNDMKKALKEPTVPGGDFYLIPAGVIAVPADQLPQVSALLAAAQWPTPPAAAAPVPTDPALPPSPGGAAPALPAGDDTKDAELPPAAPQGGKSVCIMLNLANNADLISLQRRVHQYCGGVPVEWNTPDSFHITVVYMPSVSDEQIAALRADLEQTSVPALRLRVGSLNVFDNLDSHAVHFRMKRNAELVDFQAELVELCTDHGIALSSYSQPEVYKPHITMGYAKQKVRPMRFDPKLHVEPISLQLSVGDGDINEVVLDIPVGDAPDPEPDPEDTDDVTLSPQFQKMADELTAWQKFMVKRLGKSQRREFATTVLPDGLAQIVRDRLNGVTERSELNSVFDQARKGLENWDTYQELKAAFGTPIKAYTEIRSGFIEKFVTLFNQGRVSDITKNQFGARIRSELRKSGLLMFREGLEKGGMRSESFSPEQVEAFNKWLAEEGRHVSVLTRQMYAEDATVRMAEDKVRYRATLWADLSLDRVYQLGRMVAQPEGRAVFRLGATVKHCRDCAYLNGKVATRKEWIESGWNPRSGIANRHQCGGWRCSCELEDTEEPINFDPAEYTKNRVKAAYESLSEWPMWPEEGVIEADEDMPIVHVQPSDGIDDTGLLDSTNDLPENNHPQIPYTA